MKTPRVGSVAKACTEVSTPERTRKVPSSDSEKVRIASRMRPDLQRVALFHDHRGMQQRGAGEPGHEGGVLDRIPEPPAAPAELVIGPVGAHRDADGEEHPGGQRPGPHPARPGRVDAAFDQGGDGEGEGDREADIAEIEQRRMDGEADVLQQRVEVAALERRPDEPRERVRGGQDEQKERARRSSPARPAHWRAASPAGCCRTPRPARRRGPGSAPTAASSLRDCPRRR